MNIHKKIILLKRMKRIKISFHNDRVGVSEIMGAILLLSISIALLSIVYLLVLHNATSPSSMSHVSSTNMVATLDDNHVYLQNNGGVPINPNIKIVITVSGNRYTLLVGNCLVDSNGDGKWSIGESLIFTPPGFASLRNLEVSVQVISPDDNTMLMSSLVQEGVRGDQPYVQTLPAHDVWPHNAVLKMYYNFVTNKYLPGKVWFQWREQSSTQWNFTAKTSITAGPITNFVDVPLYGLTSNKNYLFEACFQFNSSYTTVNVTGGILIFTTQIDAMGVWHFDETAGVKLLDSSGQYPPNDATIQPNDIRGPQRVSAALNHSVNALSFDGIDDLSVAANSNSLSVTDECTIETWINRSQYSNGLAGVPLQSSLAQFGSYAYGCFNPDVVHVTGGIYAIVSANENQQGYLATVNITDTGQIVSNATTCLIDVCNFETSSQNQKIIQVNASNGIYAIVYAKPSAGNSLLLRTVQISSNGQINKLSLSAPANLDAVASFTPDIIHVNGTGYAVVYSKNPSYTGALLSVNISDLGIISPVNKRLMFTGDIMQEPEIIKIVDSIDLYVIVYNCVGDDGGIRTVQITNQGTLADISHHVWFDDNDGGNPEILNIHDDVYAIVYGGPIQRQAGYLITVQIESNGSITLSRTLPPLVKSLDTFVFEMTATYKIREPHIIPVYGGFDYYAISYSVDTGTAIIPGKLVTVTILDDGTILPFTQLTVTLDPYYCQTPILFNVNQQVYGFVYRADSSDGMLKTLRINKWGRVNSSPIYDFNKLGAYNCYEEDGLLTSNGQYVAIVFRSINNCLFLKTVKVNPITKTISNEFTDSFTIEKGFISSNGTFDAAFGPTITPITNNIYAICYCKNITNPVVIHEGKIRTAYINNTGHITMLDTFTFDADCMNNPFSVLPINQTKGLYAVVYQLYSSPKGVVKTIKIDNLGNIIGIADSYTFESVRCREPSMIHVSGNVYAILYRDSQTPSTYGKVVTVIIYGNNGTIKKSNIDTWQFTTSCYHPKITQVSANVFAVTYSYLSGSYYAITATVKIASDGTITKSFIDSLAIPSSATAAYQPTIFHVTDRVYAVIYKDQTAQTNGWVATLRIGGNGDIIDTVDGSVKISINPNVASYDVKVVPFVNDSYIAMYGGINNDTYMCVFRIPISETTQNVFSKQGSYAVKANKTKVFVTFTDTGNTPYTLSANLSSNWNYIACTYDKVKMYLYVNAIPVSNISLGSKKIQTTANNLNFGPYSATYDEFSLYAAVLTQAKITQNYNYYRPP